MQCVFFKNCPTPTANPETKIVSHSGSKLAHSYQFDSFVWADDCTTAQAKLICETCSAETLVEATVSPVAHAATCTKDAYTVYTATYGDESERKTVTQTGTATGHTYETPAETDWTWTADGDSYTVTVSVSCEKGDDTKVLTATVSTPVTVPATHTENGSKTFTATATVGTQTFTAQKTDVLAADGHDWNYAAAAYAWDGFTACTATVPCKGCDETKTFEATAITFSVTTIATCTVNGEKAYTAAFDVEGIANATKTEALGKNESNHVHTRETEASASTCQIHGYTAGVFCDDCEAFVSGHEELPLAAHKYTSYTYNDDATCTADGTETALCDFGCGTENSRAKTGTKLPHTFDDPTWTWDGTTRATATFVCSKCHNPVNETAEITRTVTREATTTEEGEALYTATVTFNGTTYTDAQIKPIPVKADDSTDAGSNICDWCGKTHGDSFWQQLVALFHSVLHFFAVLFRKR